MRRVSEITFISYAYNQLNDKLDILKILSVNKGPKQNSFRLPVFIATNDDELVIVISLVLYLVLNFKINIKFKHYQLLL